MQSTVARTTRILSTFLSIVAKSESHDKFQVTPTPAPYLAGEGEGGIMRRSSNTMSNEESFDHLFPFVFVEHESIDHLPKQFASIIAHASSISSASISFEYIDRRYRWFDIDEHLSWKFRPSNQTWGSFVFGQNKKGQCSIEHRPFTSIIDSSSRPTLSIHLCRLKPFS